MKMKRVLVLEDDDILARAARRQLSKDFEVEVFLNVEEAFEALLQRRFDVIVSDVNILGGMSGTDFFRKIQQTHPELVNRFMFYSASLDPSNLSAFKVPVLLKPAPKDELIKMIHTLAG